MIKRSFDIVFSILIAAFVFPVLLLFCVLSNTKFFTQNRVGQFGKTFKIYKLKTMTEGKVTHIGKWLRKYKIDELPQLINILKGEMSIVGPRPDVAGYYDQLTGADRAVLKLKPGLTSLAAIKYRNEEVLLAAQEDPLEYNDKVIFPDKVRMNLEYLENQSLQYDLKIIFLTLTSLFKKVYLPK